MLLPVISTIRTEDFPKEQQAWIPKLLFPLNQFLLSAISAINGNLAFGDNIPCQTITLNFTYGSAADFPKIAKWNYSSTPVELRVCSATEGGSPIAVVPAWSYSNGTISIANLYKITSAGVVALTSGTTYNIVLRGLL